MNDFHKKQILDKYVDRVRIPSELDCITLVLELTEYKDIEKEIYGKYSSIKQGVKHLRKISGLNDMSEYLVSIGYDRIDPITISDFDIIIDGFHCGVYFDGYLFGVDENETFKYRYIIKNNFKEIFRWQQ